MRMLEIFCGTKSISNVFEKNGWECITLDNDRLFKPTILCDFNDWVYTNYDKNYFDYIHFSPPCFLMSQQQQTWYNKYKGRGENKYLFTHELHKKQLEEINDKLLKKIVEVLNYFNCYFTIENPYHTKFNNISKRNIFDYPYTLCNYCMYDYPLKKHTIFYNNFNLQLKLCDSSHKHMKWGDFKGGGSDRTHRYKIPVKLCEYIYEWINSLPQFTQPILD